MHWSKETFDLMTSFGLNIRQVAQLAASIETDQHIDSPQDLQKEVIEAHGNLTPGFKEWWQMYPHKIGKAAAAGAYKAAFTRSSREQLIEGLKRYIKQKPKDHPWCNPATWLQQDRWLDQPAPAHVYNGKVVGFCGPKMAETPEGTAALLQWKAKQLEKEAAHPNPLTRDEGKDKFYSLADVLKVRDKVFSEIAKKPEPDDAA